MTRRDVDTFDVIIVGGGIAGSGLATVLQRAGQSCLVLEATSMFPDRTKGEWIAPWGILDAQAVGLHAELASARGHVLRLHVGYGDHIEPAEAEDAAFDLGIIPGIKGPMTQRHPDACQSLMDAAVVAGASVYRGVTEVEVVAGKSPSVLYTHEGETHSARSRLVVGADGRNSIVRRQLGVALHRDPPHHLFSGLLVDGADDWPEDTEAIGSAGDVNFLIFPQGAGRARLYLAISLEQRHRLSGQKGPAEFLRCFALVGEEDVLPRAGAIAGSTPISPCATYENADAWTDEPYAEGIVLIGDAAGWNDPIMGQGLSITLRDIRLVSEILTISDDWSPAAFRPYAAERAERMRRLRFSASLLASIYAEFGEEAQLRRIRIFNRMAADPALLLALAATFVGPDIPRRPLK